MKTVLSPSDPSWCMSHSECEPLNIAQYETLFTLANGYAGVRASLPTSPTLGQPGFFIAGVYDNVHGEVYELVNLPSWIGLQVNVNGFDLDVTKGKLLDYQRTLDMHQSILWTKIDYQDDAGQTTRWETGRLLDMDGKHGAMIWGQITALNHSGNATLTSSLDAYSVKYSSCSGQCHFQDIVTADRGADSGIALDVLTIDTGITVAERSHLEVQAEAQRNRNLTEDRVSESARFSLEEGEPVAFCKRVSFATSRDGDDPQNKAAQHLQAMKDETPDQTVQTHTAGWEQIWDKADVRIEGDDRAQKAARFNVFHLAALGSTDEEVSIGAKGLHGTGYQGRIFWDTEQYMVPFFTHTRPEAARALLMYRYNHLDEARENAANVDCPGARIPWNSSISGREGAFTGFGWQDHQTADVAYAVDRYVRATGDEEFYLDYGAEMIIETGRFWTGRLVYDEDRGQYVCRDIMGSDEIHGEATNNALTNYLAQFNLRRAIQAVDDLKNAGRWENLREQLDIAEDAPREWEQVADSIYMPWDEDRGFHEQFDGYFELEDRTADRSMRPVEYTGPVLHELAKTQINKQADTVLLYYLFRDDFSDDVRRRGYEYYEPRTAHCSSLSRSIYAAVAAQVDKTQEAYDLWIKGAEIDYDQEASCDSGIHAASLGGAWQALIFGFAGAHEEDGELVLDPHLPDGWDRFQFRVQWRGETLKADVRGDDWELR